MAPAFNEARDKTVEASGAISNQRGGTYQDSWAIENMNPKHLDAVLSELLGLDPATVDKRIKRILMVAAMCDVKNSRWTGGFQYDTVVDTINYIAALGSWWKEFKEGKTDSVAAVIRGLAKGRSADREELTPLPPLSAGRPHCHFCGLPITTDATRYSANNGFDYHFEHRPKERPANHGDPLPR